MARSKQMSAKKATKKPNRGVDFKKIKRKIGRKLPPPKNATNTEIKSKAIVLQEQSVAFERSGLAVSSKGLTLRELLQQTSHHNAKIRRAALNGIRDITLKHPMELSAHKIVILEKLCERICDNDKVVRETIHSLLKTVIFPATKEEIAKPMLTLMMAYVFNAMTHIVVDIQLMAFQFVELIILSFPSSFFLFSDQVLENYTAILRNNKIYSEDRNRLRSILSGLSRCLSLAVRSSGEETPHLLVDRRCLHAYESVIHEHYSGVPCLSQKVVELVALLVNSFYEFISLFRAMPTVDSETFDCALSTLSNITLASKIFAFEMKEPDMPFGITEFTLNRSELCDTLLSHLKKLWKVFPIEQVLHSFGKEGNRCLILNAQVVEIFLHLIDLIDNSSFVVEKVLQYIESLLLGQVVDSSLSSVTIVEKYISAVVPFIPVLIIKVSNGWSTRLLEAFTYAFKSCRVEANLILTYLAAIKKMIWLDYSLVQFGSNCHSADISVHQIAWVREMPRILIQLCDKHPSISKVILEFLLRTGQRLLQNSSLAMEYDSMQHELKDFFGGTKTSIACGPFVYLSNDCQELAISCLFYFSNLSSELLESLACCCLCDDLMPVTLLQIVEVVGSAFKNGHLKISHYISFLVTLIIRFDVSPPENGKKSKEDLFQSRSITVPRQDTFRSLVHTVCSFISQIGDGLLVLKLLWKIIGDIMLLKLPVENLWGLLLVIVSLNKSGHWSAEEIVLLGDWLSHYLISVTSRTKVLNDLACESDQMSTLEYQILPAFSLLFGNAALLDHVMWFLNSFISDYDSSSFPIADNCTLGNRISTVTCILTLMYGNTRLHEIISSIESRSKVILQSISNLLASGDLMATISERLAINRAFDQLKINACKLHSWVTDDLCGS